MIDSVFVHNLLVDSNILIQESDIRQILNLNEIAFPLLVNELKNNIKCSNKNFNYVIIFYMLAELKCNTAFTQVIAFIKNYDNDELYEMQMSKILASLHQTDNDTKILINLIENKIITNDVKSILFETLQLLVANNIINKNQVTKIVIKYFTNILNNNINNELVQNNNNLSSSTVLNDNGDMFLISSMIDYCLDFNLIEMLPLIKNLFDNKLIDTRCNWNFTEIETDIYKSIEDRHLSYIKILQKKEDKNIKYKSDEEIKQAILQNVIQERNYNINTIEELQKFNNLIKQQHKKNKKINKDIITL